MPPGGPAKLATAVEGRIVVGVAGDVEAELPDIAVHVVQAEPVPRERSGAGCRAPENPDGTLAVGTRDVFDAVVVIGGDALAVTVSAHGPACAAIIRQIGGDCRPYMERTGAAGATGIFPFGLARQPVIAARNPGETPAILNHLDPADAFDRQIDPSEKLWAWVEIVLQSSWMRHNHR